MSSLEVEFSNKLVEKYGDNTVAVLSSKKSEQGKHFKLLTELFGSFFL